MSEIKPRMVNGEAICTYDCPSSFEAPGPCRRCRHRYQYADAGSTCWPYYRARTAELEAENEWLRKDGEKLTDDFWNERARVKAAEAELAKVPGRMQELRRNVKVEVQGCSRSS